MIVKTASSIYEVDEAEKRFRRIHQFGLTDQRLLTGQWYRFQRMSPPQVGQPIRFYWILSEEGGMARIGLWATSPVTEILVGDAADEAGRSFLLPERPAPSPS